MRRSSVTSLVVVGTLLSAAGCQTDCGEWNVRKFLGWEDSGVPNLSKFPKASTQIAERVEMMGRSIVARNSFLGIEPQFYTIGVQDSVLFHRGPEELFISEGLVNLCKSDAELAAVLCSEMAQMVAEKKAGKRVGADRDSIQNNALPGGSPPMTGGGQPYDMGRLAEQAYAEQRPKPTPYVDSAAVAKLARDMLKGAGFDDPTAMDQVQPLLKQSDRGAAIRKQMSGSSPAPSWNWSW